MSCRWKRNRIVWGLAFLHDHEAARVGDEYLDEWDERDREVQDDKNHALQPSRFGNILPCRVLICRC